VRNLHLAVPWVTIRARVKAMSSNSSKYRWVILGIGILAYGTSQFSRQNYAGVQKFIAADLGLDRGALGLMGSAFFYSYALFQMPSGVASDRFGSRWVIGLGILLTAATMSAFALGETTGSLVFWRIMSGVAAALVYVPLTGGIARWFSTSERGLSQGTAGGVGGALGEGAAYALLPILSIYFASGWRQGMHMIAAAIALIGLLCLALFRSAPPGEAATTRKPFDWRLLRDLQLWCYAFLWSGFVIGIRITQIWIAVYAADLYISGRGMPLNEAVVAGGVLALVAYSLVGRAAGCPLAGRLSDLWVSWGISRTAVLIGWLVLGMALLQVLSMGVTAIWALAIIAALLGTSVNLFSLVPAAISDTFGPQRTASLSSFANTMAQLSGATALAVSGYVGISLNAQPGNALTEYRGIWLSGVVGMAVMAVLAIAAYAALRNGWVTRPAPIAAASSI
jgi:MFS transporter, OPA family, sugar phosphate sensor protein UhpC